MERLVICEASERCTKDNCQHKERHFPTHVSNGKCTYEYCTYNGVEHICVPYLGEEVTVDESNSIRPRTLHEASDEAMGERFLSNMHWNVR